MKSLIAYLFLFSTLCASSLASATSYPSGAVAYWGFNEGSGSTCYDSAGSNDGVLYGPSWGSGIVGGALSFDGIDDYVSVPDHSSLDIAGSFTVEAWVKGNEDASANRIQTLVAKDDGPYRQSDNYYFVYDHVGDQIGGATLGPGVFIKQDPEWYCSGPTSGLSAGRWYHLAGVWDGSELSLYVDGRLDASESTDVGALPTNSFPVLLGTNHAGDQFYNGLMDEVLIYDRALSAEEIRGRYRQLAPIPEPASLVLLGIGIAALAWRRREF
ncbi:MAG: LamG-like jellyroll fold domain-containing protein [Planctomycetota bacterium]